jgi:histidyl-tRNA synthetase
VLRLPAVTDNVIKSFENTQLLQEGTQRSALKGCSAAPAMSLSALHSPALGRCLPRLARCRAGRRALTLTPHAAAAEAASAASGRAATRSDAASDSDEKIDLAPPKGTRDCYPDDMRLRKWLFGEFEAVSQLFGFEPYDAPLLENEALFVRKAGEEIREQLFNFRDKGGRAMALRPELTPSLARMVLAKGASLALPAKWYGIGQCWRYERMARGRRREHYQWNMDIVGAAGVAAEAELLAAVTAFFTRVGVTAKDVKIRVNNRKVLQAVAERYDIAPGSFSAVCVVLDKLEKLPTEEVEKQLDALGVPRGAAASIVDAMGARTVADIAGILGEDHAAVAELRELFELAEGYGYAEWLVYDASVVRGLAYYTGTVFEAFDREGKLRAICGGGRYDALLGALSGGGDNSNDVPMVGFGFGDAVIVELLKDKGLLPAVAHGVQDVVLCMEPALRRVAGAAAARLRGQGRSVDVVLETKKMKWAFKHAERLSAERLVLVGAREWEQGKVRVKDLAAREEVDVPLDEL